jgi:Cu-Zn family superoxide dismutase
MMESGIAVLNGSIKKNFITFNPLSSKVTEITYYIEGLEPFSVHAMHIHQFGDQRKGCESAGPHFNPYNAPHGAPENNKNHRHVGDLGNIVANAQGVASGTILDPLIKISGKNSVIGRSLVIHQDPDDLGLGNHKDSLTTGNAGKRLACGIIGIAPGL